MNETYHTPTYKPSPDCPTRRGDGCGAAAIEPQAAASTIDLADLLCGPVGNRSGLDQIGDKWVGRCPLPDCAAKLPSFVVWPGTDTWRCYACLRGGGVTELACLAGAELVAKARGW